VITGDSGNGMTHCTIGAMIITDQILHRQNPWEDLYDPSRISLRAMPTYLKENFNVAAQYPDWIITKSAHSLEEIPRGEGRVFRDGSQLVAAYKNELGVCHTVSAVCPHLGGIVSWNWSEKSWDCTCQGSRFDGQRRVIEGPALRDLEIIEYVEPAVVAERVSPLENSLKTGHFNPA